jgi:formate dehydrogenase major subunit
MPHITVDGEPHEVPEGATLLEALRSAGADVPTLCHDDRLKPRSVCRMCVVEVEGRPRPVPSCSTLVTEGMLVRTRGKTIEKSRQTTFELLVNQMAREAAGPHLVDDSHPYIHVDMSRCIDCLRCVRICEEVQGQSVWKVWNRGDRSELHPDDGVPFGKSSCVSCGACVTSCPTGALSDKDVLAPELLVQSATHTRTTCPYCGVGCELDVEARGGRIARVLPVMDSPVNKGHSCVKGRYAFEFVASADRLTTPLIREQGALRPASWAEAIAFIATALTRIVRDNGPDAAGVLGSARSTNEENYVAQKFARIVLGTNNVDCCARVCHAPSARALSATLGTGAATSSFDDIERAETIMVCGSNALEAHPVVGARIRQRALAGANLIVVDPRKTELARVPGAIHLAVHPGANVALFNAMAAVIVEEELVDEEFVRARVDGLDELGKLVASYRPEDVARETGVAPELVRKAARLWAKARPSISFHGLGMTEHLQGTDGVMSLVNLALLTGNVGKPGTGVNPLRGQNNVQGSAHMGCEPTGLTGLVQIDAAAPRFELAWGAPIPRARGMKLTSMLDAALGGKFKALWMMGYDVLLSNPDMATTRKSLEALELLVVQDIFLNETAKELAHVVLPSACSFEKDGTFMNAERRVQRVRKAVDAPGEARTDWEPLCDVARAMGKGAGFEFRSAEDIWEEIRNVWPDGRGITYARLEHGGIQWPCRAENDPGTTLLHVDAFSGGPRARLRSIPFTPTPERTTDEYPFVLVTGRALSQFNAGTMTMRTKNRLIRPSDRLDMSPSDAARLDLHEGERMRVASHWGEAELPLHVDAELRAGELFATFHDPVTKVNLVLGRVRDNQTETPEYKVTAVSVTPVREERRKKA